MTKRRRTPADRDAFGRLVYDHYRGVAGAEIIEREDGWVGAGPGAAAYFAGFDAWPAHQRRAIRAVRGRALDVGCGAGRVALYLQARGNEVVAIDSSPLAVKTSRLRGVLDARVLSIVDVDRHLGTFDSIVMFGNNFGLFGSPRRARWLLWKFHAMTSGRARIVAESRNPYRGATTAHRAYHRLNRARRRPPGQIRMRVRYERMRTAWFDYLMVSPREMRRLIDGTGWRVVRLIESNGPMYVAVLEKVEG